MELRIRRMIRWNALAMVLRANTRFEGIGGHLSTYASAASLYEVGFNHFFRGPDDGSAGDQIYFQATPRPASIAPSWRAPVGGAARPLPARGALAGRPVVLPAPAADARLLAIPTGQHGAGPINAIYQARFNRYLAARGIADTSASRVWGFLGDGEMDEPEALGALGLAAREGLDNLIFVVNCNLQRLDGPVRGNGKIIQELEATFRGAGWHVIKVIWAREWDDLLARDKDGVLLAKMNETLDGDYQRLSVADGAYIREHFFGPDPRLKALVEHLPDEDLPKLRRGGHDYRKVYAAAARGAHRCASRDPGQDGQGLGAGPGIEARNITHQAKKLTQDELKIFRDRLELPIPDDQLADAPYYHPGAESPEIQYMLERRSQLGGVVPRRLVRPMPLPDAADEAYAELFAGSERPASTTMAFSRLTRNLTRDPAIGRRIVPIIPDEARTFGMDLFKEVGIYNPLGQRYTPVDKELLLIPGEGGRPDPGGGHHRGRRHGRLRRRHLLRRAWPADDPFYIFYSMFGFQRTGDLAWAFGDARGRGFPMGATAGRTTLTGEGLQHDDGHSHILASVLPNIRAYDPAFAYELAVIVRDGVRRMYGEAREDVFYYVTLQRELGDAAQARWRGRRDHPRHVPVPAGRQGLTPVQLLASGSILHQAIKAQPLLAERYDVAADLWSVPSFQLLRNEALEVERWNRLHPEAEEACRTWSSSWLRPKDRSWPPPTTSRRCRTWWRRGWIGRHCAGHRRLRPQRHARGAAHAFRGQPGADRLRRAARPVHDRRGRPRGAGAGHRRAGDRPERTDLPRA